MIAIGMCVDRRYFVPALVTLVSLAEAHTTGTIHRMSVRLISPDMTRSEAATFAAVTRRLGFGSFACQRILPSPAFPHVSGDYISAATYLRFSFTDAFVQEPLLLYLDADILVTGDMTEPFDQLHAEEIGAVQDQIVRTASAAPALPGFVDKYPEFSNAPYFNAGALWLQTSSLAGLNRGARRVTRLRRQHIHFDDQDVLNMLLLEASLSRPVPVRFNRFELARFSEINDWIAPLAREARNDVGSNALHFIGAEKPWLRQCPATPGVALYARSLRAARLLISRVRDATICLPM